MSIYTPTEVRLTPYDTPDDGDDVTAASVGIGLEALGDGLEWVSKKHDALADLAALRAIDTTSLTNGTVRLVAGQGFFELNTGSAATEREPFIIDPTTGPGRWHALTAHATTLTRIVGCADALRGMPSAANAPSVSSSWRPIPQSSSIVFDRGGFINQNGSTHATNAWGFLFGLNEWLVDGSTLSSVTFRYEPANVGANPAVFPQIAVCRSTRNGSLGAIEHLNSGGFIIDSGGTYEFGTIRDLVYTPDQANGIALATYDYFAVVYDEHGANAVSGNTLISLALAMTAIPDARR